MWLEYSATAAKWIAIILIILTVSNLSKQMDRWRVVKQLYGSVSWNLVRQMLWYARKSPMGSTVKRTFAFFPVTVVAAVRWIVYDDPIEYLLVLLTAHAYGLVRVADVVRPPAILILGPTSEDNAKLLGTLNFLGPSYRTIACLELKERLQFELVQPFYFNSFRTRNRYEWRSTVFHLMDIVPVIVFNGIGDSTPVEEELRRVERLRYQDRVIYVSNDFCPDFLKEVLVPRERLLEKISNLVMHLPDSIGRKERQTEIESFAFAVPRRVREPQTLEEMIVKARCIEEHECLRFVRTQSERDFDWWETPLLEDLPKSDDSRAELDIFRNRRGLEEVEILLISALESVENINDPVARFNAASVHNKLGRLARIRGNWQESISHTSLAIELFRAFNQGLVAHGSLCEQSIGHFILGEVFMAQNRETHDTEDLRNAKKHFQESIAIDQKTGDDPRLALLRIATIDKSNGKDS